MNRAKLSIGLNLLWVVVAIGAYLTGRHHVAGTSTLATDTREPADHPALVVANIPGGGGSSGTNARTTISGVPLHQYPKNDSAEGAGKMLESALTELDPIRRKLRVAELLDNLNEENLPSILQAFEDAPRNEDTGQHFRDFLYAWGRLSGEEAMAYVRDPDSKRKERSGIVVAISGWAAADTPAAQDYVAKVEKKETREWMHYGVLQEILKTDLDAAVAYSETNTKSSARGRQMDRIVATLMEQRGIAGVQEWLDGIDHTKKGNDLVSYKRYAASIALDRMAAEDPQLAADWIETHAGQPYLTSDGLERAARRAAGPIDKELDWLAALPSVDGQRHAIGERFEDYIRENFEGAGEWLASQPLGPAYDEAIQDYARSAVRDNAGAAVAWAGRISDPEIRERTLKLLAPKIRKR